MRRMLLCCLLILGCSASADEKTNYGAPRADDASASVSCGTRGFKLQCWKDTGEVINSMDLPGAGANRERRERIATAVLAALISSRDVPDPMYHSKKAVEYADALMAELDKE